MCYLSTFDSSYTPIEYKGHKIHEWRLLFSHTAWWLCIHLNRHRGLSWSHFTFHRSKHCEFRVVCPSCPKLDCLMCPTFHNNCAQVGPSHHLNWDLVGLCISFSQQSLQLFRKFDDINLGSSIIQLVYTRSVENLRSATEWMFPG